MARGSSNAARRGASPLLLLAVALAAAVAAADDNIATTDAAAPDAELATNRLAGRVRVSSDAEAQVAAQMLKAFASISREITTGVPEDDDGTVTAASISPDVNVSSVDLNSLSTKIFASAMATWQLGVWEAPTNRNLHPKKFTMYDRDHYYQIPKDPIGTLVMFHGCVHDASGSWPYDPVGCPECLGLPEEVAHVKQALAWGFAVLAVESRNREPGWRCFAYSMDASVTDHLEAPYIVQSFIYDHGLQMKPIYAMGVSSGASFASKFPKTFYDAQYHIKVSGVISEVNANDFDSWGLVDGKGRLRYPSFPAVAYLAMENDPRTSQAVMSNVHQLRDLGIASEAILVKERPVADSFFYDRSPVVSAAQSAQIVGALRGLGVLDEEGFVRNDPRLANFLSFSVMYKWNLRLAQKLPWLHLDPLRPPMLSVLSDRSTIYEEMNVAFARHEIIADHLVPCLVWLQSNGTLDLNELSDTLSVSVLRDLTMTRVYASPPPPAAAAVATPKPAYKPVQAAGERPGGGGGKPAVQTPAARLAAQKQAARKRAAAAKAAAEKAAQRVAAKKAAARKAAAQKAAAGKTAQLTPAQKKAAKLAAAGKAAAGKAAAGKAAQLTPAQKKAAKQAAAGKAAAGKAAQLTPAQKKAAKQAAAGKTAAGKAAQPTPAQKKLAKQAAAGKTAAGKAAAGKAAQPTPVQKEAANQAAGKAAAGKAAAGKAAQPTPAQKTAAKKKAAAHKAARKAAALNTAAAQAQAAAQ